MPRSSPIASAPALAASAGERADHQPVVVPDVGAAVGRHAFRHPPQPHQAHHVVYPQAASVPERRAEQVGERPGAGCGKALRMPRRLRPVLPALVEPVGRRTDADPAHQQVLVCPGIGTAGMRRRRRDRRSRRCSCRPRGRPAAPRQAARPSATAARRGTRHARRAVPTGGDVPHAADRPAPLASRASRARAARPARTSPPTLLARRPHGRRTGGSRPAAPRFAPRPWISSSASRFADQTWSLSIRSGVLLAARSGSASSLDILPLGRVQQLVLVDVLDPQVERAGVPAAHRQIRGAADRDRRLGSMQRVDQDEVRAEVPGRPAGQVRQIVQVAVAPGAPGPDRVELDGQAPGPCARDSGPDRGRGRSARQAARSPAACPGRRRSRVACRQVPGPSPSASSGSWPTRQAPRLA